MTVDRVQQAADAITALSGATPADARRALTEFPVRDLVAALAVGGGVSCVLASSQVVDIHDTGSYPINWSGLKDNIRDQNTIDAIPAGLGLEFEFDGSSATITTTTAGVWSFTYTNFFIPGDATWKGGLDTSEFTQPIHAGADGADVTVSVVFALPTEAIVEPNIFTGTQATTDPLEAFFGNLTVVRLA